MIRPKTCSAVSVGVPFVLNVYIQISCNFIVQSNNGHKLKKSEGLYLKYKLSSLQLVFMSDSVKTFTFLSCPS